MQSSSQWVLTQVVKITPALVHTIVKTAGPARSQASSQEYKISTRCIINIYYTVDPRLSNHLCTSQFSKN